jgi:hypothetical protein
VRALTLVLGDNERLVAQLLLSALVLSQPLYSVYLTLSHATLYAFALVLVVKIVVALLFAPQAGKKKRRQSTPEVFLTAKTRAVETHRRGARNAALAHGARQRIVRGLIVTEEVPCRGPGKRATHFAKCLVHVGTILAHLAATSFYQPGDLGEHRLTTLKKKEVPPNTTSRWHPRARHVVVILRHKMSWKPESRVLGLAVET